MISEPCVNNQHIHGAGKQYSGCNLIGEFLAMTLFMRRSICVRGDWEGFLRTNTYLSDFGMYNYYGVECPDPNTYTVTSGGYGEAYMKNVDFPGALT